MHDGAEALSPKWRRPSNPFLRCAEDGGDSWKRERSTDDVAANLYQIKFTHGNNGFILGEHPHALVMVLDAHGASR